MTTASPETDALAVGVMRGLMDAAEPLDATVIALTLAGIAAKDFRAALSDREFWDKLRENMIARMRPIFMKTFERGAELGAEQTAVSEKAIGFRDTRAFDALTVSDQAGRVISEYTDEWYEQFEKSTQRKIKASIARANLQGEGIEAITRDLTPLFGEVRAQRIAVSETTTLLGQGAQETYRQNGFKKWEWRTVRDSFVDDICRDLNGKQFDLPLPATFERAAVTGKKFERAHVNCRCFPSPVGKATFDPASLNTATVWKDANGKWDAARGQLHDEIIRNFMSGTTRVQNPISFMQGGGPASGKSSIIDSGFVKFPKNMVKIDADAIKQLLPEYQRAIAAGDPFAAALTHQESSYISQRLLDEAVRGGRNLLLDGTGDGSLSKLAGRIERMRAEGARVVANYVSLDTDLAVKIQRIRAAETGREVPEQFLRDNHAKISEILPDALERNLFDDLSLWDTNLKDNPRLILTHVDGVTTIVDEGLWQDFLAKAAP